MYRLKDQISGEKGKREVRGWGWGKGVMGDGGVRLERMGARVVSQEEVKR